MAVPHEAVDAALGDIDKLRRVLKRGTAKQVSSRDETGLIRATSLAWFNSYRPSARAAIDDELMQVVDAAYHELMRASDKATSRTRYDAQLKSLRNDLSELRAYAIAPPKPSASTTDAPPAFNRLVPDPGMQVVLERRWSECLSCVEAGAPLAATVMMGGLLEAVLLARVHREPNKTSIFGAKSAPKDRRTGKTLPLNEWMLRNYIDVAHEIGWIATSARDVGEVLRDYRNYIHPHKEFSHGVVLTMADSQVLWEVAKVIVRQVLP